MFLNPNKRYFIIKPTGNMKLSTSGRDNTERDSENTQLLLYTCLVSQLVHKTCSLGVCGYWCWSCLPCECAHGKQLALPNQQQKCKCTDIRFPGCWSVLEQCTQLVCICNAAEVHGINIWHAHTLLHCCKATCRCIDKVTHCKYTASTNPRCAPSM